MSDLVERLRHTDKKYPARSAMIRLKACDEAADRIEQLEADFKLANEQAKANAIEIKVRGKRIAKLEAAIEAVILDMGCEGADWCGKSPRGTPGKKGYDNGMCDICNARKETNLIVQAWIENKMLESST